MCPRSQDVTTIADPRRSADADAPSGAPQLTDDEKDRNAHFLLLAWRAWLQQRTESGPFEAKKP